jgi:hypothetical protein
VNFGGWKFYGYFGAICILNFVQLDEKIFFEEKHREKNRYQKYKNEKTAL